MVLLVGSSLLIRTFLRLASAEAGLRSQRRPYVEGRAIAEKISGQRKESDILRADSRKRADDSRACKRRPSAEGCLLIGSRGRGRASLLRGVRNRLRADGRRCRSRSVSPAYFQSVQQSRSFAAAHSRKPIAGPSLSHRESSFRATSSTREKTPWESGSGLVPASTWREIVGIVGNVKQQGRRPDGSFHDLPSLSGGRSSQRRT